MPAPCTLSAAEARLAAPRSHPSAAGPREPQEASRPRSRLPPAAGQQQTLACRAAFSSGNHEENCRAKGHDVETLFRQSKAAKALRPPSTRTRACSLGPGKRMGFRGTRRQAPSRLLRGREGPTAPSAESPGTDADLGTRPPRPAAPRERSAGAPTPKRRPVWSRDPCRRCSSLCWHQFSDDDDEDKSPAGGPTMTAKTASLAGPRPPRPPRDTLSAPLSGPGLGGEVENRHGPAFARLEPPARAPRLTPAAERVGPQSRPASKDRSASSIMWRVLGGATSACLATCGGGRDSQSILPGGCNHFSASRRRICYGTPSTGPSTCAPLFTPATGLVVFAPTCTCSCCVPASDKASSLVALLEQPAGATMLLCRMGRSWPWGHPDTAVWCHLPLRVWGAGSAVLPRLRFAETTC